MTYAVGTGLPSCKRLLAMSYLPYGSAGGQFDYPFVLFAVDYGRRTYMRRKTWRDSETCVARQFGGRTQPGSGSRWFAKGDVKAPDKLIQVKITEGKQFTLKLADLEEAERQALAANCDSLFVVMFKTKAGVKEFVIQKYYGPASTDSRPEASRP